MEGKFNDLDEKSSKVFRILNNNNKTNRNVLEMKTLINHFKNSVESMTNKLNQVQQRISKIENKVDEL
jgi:uncharacterized protein Yka (UPF0111/DUF47 family)